jgi:hypothetical protein
MWWCTGNAERGCDVDDRRRHPDLGLRGRRIAGGVIVHETIVTGIQLRAF